MKTFTDKAGRVWTLDVTVACVERVRSLASFDPMSIVEPKAIDSLINDPVVLCDVLYAAIKPQADSLGVTDEQFGQSLGGDELDAALSALLEELVGFFRPAQREVLRSMLGKIREVETRAAALAMTRLSDPSLDRKIDQLLNPSAGSSTS